MLSKLGLHGNTWVYYSLLLTPESRSSPSSADSLQSAQIPARPPFDRDCLSRILLGVCQKDKIPISNLADQTINYQLHSVHLRW